MTPEIGDFDINVRDNDNFNEQTDYRPITDGKGKPWPIEEIINDKRQKWQPEVKRKIWA